jgi:transcriptional regulator with XRE-family HTH domain
MSDGARFGARLRKLRLARGMTQKELAGDRYTHAYVSSIEAGRRMPSRDALDHFAARLDVEVDELLTGRPRGFEAALELRLHQARIDLSAGREDEAGAALAACVRDAGRNGLTRLEARAEEALGLLEERRRAFEDALAHYRAAEELLADEPATARVDAVAGKAACFAALGDVRYAIHLLESMLDGLVRAGLEDPDALARLHASLAEAYVDAMLYARAAEAAAELEALAPHVRDPLRVAQMHLGVARLHLAEGRVRDADTSLLRAGDAYRALRLQAETGFAHLARGYALRREGELDAARAELESALAVFESTGGDADVARALNELARVERLSATGARARTLLERSIALAHEVDPSTLAWAHRELGLTLGEDDPATGEGHLRTAIDLYERVEQPAEIAATYRALGDLLAGREAASEAADAYRTGILALESRV